MFKTFAVTVLCLIAFSLCAKETKKADLSIDKQYEQIVKSIKDNPKQAIRNLKGIADKNYSAVIEYLILLSIYEPEKVNSSEFEQHAQILHAAITQQYEEIVAEQPFYKSYQDNYLESVKDDYLECYKNLNCLIEVGAYHFSKFFSIWDKPSGDMQYVPWRIVVPCPTARKLHLTAIMDGAGGGHGAEALDISNCEQYPQYRFPKDVEEYREYISRKLELYNSGSIRFVYAASDRYWNILNHYDPDWDMKNNYFPKETLQAMPLEAWSMESYPNYKYASEVWNYGIGFHKAVDKLAQHYVKTFKVDKAKAQQYARYVMTPWAAKSLPINKETLRYKIFSDVPVAEIKSWIEEKKLHGEEFEELEMPHQADEILMISVHRPDVLKMLLEICPADEEKLNCIGLDTDVNTGNEFGKTALMYAAQYGFMDSVKILLEAGADINAQTHKGNMKGEYCWENICLINGERTALMYAVQEGNLDIAKYLVEQGADITLKDSKRMNVYDYLSGKAPYLGNFRSLPTKGLISDNYFSSKNQENKNVTPEKAEEFMSFLEKYKKL